jgi:CHAD domain-containing protein
VQAAFRTVVDDALARIETNARGVLESDDPEFLHQLRVGQRRLRSALRAFRGAVAKEKTTRLRRSLRRVSTKLGAARDWDVLVQRLAAARETGLLARAQGERDKARQSARRTIRSRIFGRLAREARAVATSEASQSLRQFAAAALDRAHRKLLAREPIDWKDAAQRHSLRIRVKRLRYSCEFFAPAFPARSTAAYVDALKALQEILGELNDIAVGRRLIGFEADEAALLRRLRPAWARFRKRPAFWRARA